MVTGKNNVTGKGAVLFFLAMVPLGIWRAYVLTILWRWFVVSLGGPALAIVPALGISLLYSMMSGSAYKDATSDKDVDDGDLFQCAFKEAFVTTALLGMGWAIHQFQ
jgi:hypothetical protein